MPDPREGDYAIDETLNVLIPMRDGTRLSGNLYLPRGAGPVPAIVIYTPYLKDRLSGTFNDRKLHFVRRGYACIDVDVRGIGGSDGIMAPPLSPSEKQDARDLHDWIAAQSWCDGTTGQWGLSYTGSTSIAAASMQPPSLKAIVSMHATPDEFLGFLHPHGCQPAWWTENSWGPGQIIRHVMPPPYRDADRRWARIWRERLERYVPWPFLWHTTPVETYMSWKSDLSKVTAATYAISGWHDYYPKATLDYFTAINAPKKVLIGPWKHQFPSVGPSGQADDQAEMDRWWDHWLRGLENGVMDSPPVMVWNQGENAWRYEESWPPKRSEPRLLFAGADGALIPDRPTDSGADRYVVDPTVGIDLLPWDPQAPVVPMPYDRSGDDHRSQTYTTAPLERDLEIVGDPEAMLYLIADQPEFPISAWLCDVTPNGRSTLISQGWISASFAVGEPLRSDRAYEIRVPLYSTSYRIPAGHRLRFGLAGADFPLLWPAAKNPTLQIERSPARATHVRLPVAPIPGAPLPGPAFDRTTGIWVNTPSGPGKGSFVTRDLSGRFVEFQQVEGGPVKNADGSIVHVKTENVSRIDAEHPDEMTLTGRAEATIDYGGNTVSGVVDVIQSRDHYRVAATVTIDNKSYFEKTWDLDL
jgi:putative CocE/NonD family hydrolase